MPFTLINRILNATRIASPADELKSLPWSDARELDISLTNGCGFGKSLDNVGRHGDPSEAGGIKKIMKKGLITRPSFLQTISLLSKVRS